MTKILGGILLIAAAVIFASIFAGLASVGWTVMVRVMLETFQVYRCIPDCSARNRVVRGVRMKDD